MQFAEWCLTSSERETRTPDRPFSLFEGVLPHLSLSLCDTILSHAGLAGTLYFYSDLLNGPENAAFPAFDLPVVTHLLSL